MLAPLHFAHPLAGRIRPFAQSQGFPRYDWSCSGGTPQPPTTHAEPHTTRKRPGDGAREGRHGTDAGRSVTELTYRTVGHYVNEKVSSGFARQTLFVPAW